MKMVRRDPAILLIRLCGNLIAFAGIGLSVNLLRNTGNPNIGQIFLALSAAFAFAVIGGVIIGGWYDFWRAHA